jgi:hypothetical protein
LTRYLELALNNSDVQDIHFSVTIIQFFDT